jgi:hypothetical protein
MAPLIEYIRLLRDESDAAVMFVQHSGHQGDHMRGRSDMESVWESRPSFARAHDDIVTIKAEHREADSGDPIAYRLHADDSARTIRLRPTVLPLPERIIEHLREHGPMGAEELAKGIETRRSDVDRVLGELQDAGTTRRGPSGKLDALGRPATNKVWHLNQHATLPSSPGRPDGRTTRDDLPASGARVARSSRPLERDDRDDPPGRADNNGSQDVADIPLATSEHDLRHLDREAGL